MTGYLLIAYVLIGAAVATEVGLRIRDHMLSLHVTFRPDGEDIAVMIAGGVLWPLTVVAGLWLKFYLWRKEQGRGPA